MINQSKFERLKAVWSDKERYWVMGWCFGPGGNGDLIYNTARKIIEENITDPSDYGILENIFKCLNEGKRWPDYMDNEITTINHKQTDTTKDGWILAYCCAIYLNRCYLIKLNTPPTKPTGDKWRSASFFRKPELSWYKALIGEKNSYWFWSFFNYFIPVPHTYVMAGFMEQAYKTNK